MTRNASCFAILRHAKNYLHSLIGKSSYIPYLYNSVSLIRASNYPTLYMNAQKTIESMASTSDPKWCDTRPIRRNPKP